jgi:2-hydroxy-6-oxonona-2,4-dienedioate hydrolase
VSLNSGTREEHEIRIRSGRIVYELLGPESGPPIVLTPGGRFSKDVPGLRPLAEALAEGGMRVLIWDRPNGGASDIQLWGESESHMRAEILAQLLRELELAPCVIAGGSGGARDSALTVVLHPEVATKLAVWNIVGGTFSTMSLAMVYVLGSINMVHSAGIEGVIAMPEWQGLISANPENERILRELGTEGFYRVMTRWMDAYVPKAGYTIPGVPDWQLRDIDVPTLIIRSGQNDIHHPKRVSFEVHHLIGGSRLVEPPWPEDAWEQSLKAMGAGTGNMFDSWVQAAPLLASFASE